MRELARLFNTYGSDKDLAGYTPVYHTLLARRRDDPLTLLEIGIGTMIPGVRSSMHSYALPGYRPGGSLRAWRDFFRRGLIYGVDVQRDTQLSEERIVTALCDSTSPPDVARLMATLNICPDIIVDDGSHVCTDQLSTLSNFYPYLSANGLYFIEDINPECQFLSRPELIRERCNGDAFFFVALGHFMCVICKHR